MKKTALLLITLTAAAITLAGKCPLETFNEQGYGTISLRAQTLSMYRDYEGLGNGHSTSLGWKLDYLTPNFAGLSAGASFIQVDLLGKSGGNYGKNGEALLSNGNLNILNELWVKYSLEAAGLTNTFIKVGRQVLNTEVIRKDEFRQKPKAVEAAVLVSEDLIPDTKLVVGHLERLSNIWDNNNAWKYKDIEDLLGGNNGNGLSWVELVNNSLDGLEIALYDAYAYDVVNLAGIRAKVKISDDTSINAYYRNEQEVGNGADHAMDMYSLTLEQKIGDVTVISGFLSIAGDKPKFEEIGTGINHPLDLSLMFYSGVWEAGADTYFVRAATKVGKTKLYGLYNYTTHDRNSYEGQELDVVAARPITDKLSVAVKAGIGYRNGEANTADTTATDARLFVTYTF